MTIPLIPQPLKNWLFQKLPLGTGRSVVRGGFGIFYPTSAAQGIRDAFGSTPFNQGRRRRTRLGLSLGGWPGGLTPAGQVPVSGGSLDAASTVPSANLIPFDLQQPRIEQYNVTVERELGWKTGLRFSYLGSRLRSPDFADPRIWLLVAVIVGTVIAGSRFRRRGLG